MSPELEACILLWADEMLSQDPALKIIYIQYGFCFNYVLTLISSFIPLNVSYLRNL